MNSKSIYRIKNPSKSQIVENAQEQPLIYVIYESYACVKAFSTTLKIAIPAAVAAAT